MRGSGHPYIPGARRKPESIERSPHTRALTLCLTPPNYGHRMAIVACEIEFTRDAHCDFRSLDAHVRAAIREALEVHLRHEPTKVSKSRIKRLRALRRPQYRLRINNFRIYYDVEDEMVTVLGVVSKAASYDWLADNSIEEDD